MNEFVAKDWDDLNGFIWPRLYSQEFGKYRTYIAFRGQNARYDNLKTSLQRLTATHLRCKESRLINRFRTYGIDHLNQGQSDWDVLMLGQHYRLPSRLLDWTASPFIAMYFACEECPDDDGEIWCVDRLKTIELLPKRFKDMLGEQGGFCFSIETLKGHFKSLPDFDCVDSDCLLFIEPPSVDTRIINQFSVFSVMTNPESRTDSFLAEHPGVYCKIIIPHSLKKEILERLFIMNISARTVYPDLGGLTKMLGWYFR
jgi:hypothetical protein